jgi:FdhE protein
VALCDFAARPALRAGRAVVAAVLVEARWRRGICPACGAPPLLAELGAAERQRRLRCGRCAAAWVFPRLRCPACDASEHRNFRYLHEEGDGESRRVEVCDGCGTYLKSVAVLDPLSAEQLLEMDLATAALDAEAITLGLRHV